MKLGEDTSDVLFQSEAVKALAKTGSARCLPALEEALQWLQRRPNDLMSKNAVAPLQNCLKKVRARVAVMDEEACGGAFRFPAAICLDPRYHGVALWRCPCHE